MTYWIARGIFKLFLKLWNRIEYFGADNIPAEGGCIIAANHVSYLDPPVIGTGVSKRKVRFMARDTLMNSAFMCWLLPRLEIIPIKREKGDLAAFRVSLAELKKGSLIGLFPEGTRSPDGSLQAPKRGVGLIVSKSGATVVPAYIMGSFEAFSKGASSIKPHKINVYYGKPIEYEKYKHMNSDEISKAIMDAIAELKQQNMPV